MKSLEPGRRGCFPGPVRRFLLVAVLALAVAWVLPAAASAALTATQIRIGVHPAFDRVVVDFTGGTLHLNDVESPDPLPYGGLAKVRVTAPGITTTAHRASSKRLWSVRIKQGSGSILVKLVPKLHRFKYLEYSVLHSPERLVIDLWRARPPRAAAEFPVAPQGGCLSIDNFTEAPGRITANGSESDVFEHMFTAAVRDRHGKVLRSRGVTATAGHWHRIVPYSVADAQPGTLEAVDFSAKDGSLTCIAQVRVALAPAP